MWYSGLHTRFVRYEQLVVGECPWSGKARAHEVHAIEGRWSGDGLNYGGQEAMSCVGVPVLCGIMEVGGGAHARGGCAGDEGTSMKGVCPL